MASFRVTASELKAKAGTLREYNGQFKTQVEGLSEQEGSLIGMWEGMARDAFDKAFQQDKLQMDNFAMLVDQYCEALELIASKYELAENQNYNTATTRSY
ncbi:MAG: WXG100 family type VII secretion target [Lachnospiraceae bacterium]|nr:WXG100 family type VII secretion target [Lachnospiraceae bacterium]